MNNHILITETPTRSLQMSQEGNTLILLEKTSRSSPYVFIEPEELALIVLSTSGSFQKRYVAEVTRLQNTN